MIVHTVNIQIIKKNNLRTKCSSFFIPWYSCLLKFGMHLSGTKKGETKRGDFYLPLCHWMYSDAGDEIKFGSATRQPFQHQTLRHTKILLHTWPRVCRGFHPSLLSPCLWVRRVTPLLCQQMTRWITLLKLGLETSKTEVITGKQTSHGLVVVRDQGHVRLIQLKGKSLKRVLIIDCLCCATYLHYMKRERGSIR